MAQVIVDPKKIKSFRSAAEFEKWLSKQHDRESELWLRGLQEGFRQADGDLRRGAGRGAVLGLDRWASARAYDEISFLQRYSPRKPKSIWSHINRENVRAADAAGRMTPHGQKHIDAAKADGRWDAAYAPIRSSSPDTIPERSARRYRCKRPRSQDLRIAQPPESILAEVPDQQHENAGGSGQKIETLVAMLARGETVVPQRLEKKPVCEAGEGEGEEAELSARIDFVWSEHHVDRRHRRNRCACVAPGGEPSRAGDDANATGEVVFDRRRNAEAPR